MLALLYSFLYGLARETDPRCEKDQANPWGAPFKAK
jgi:hypothetical protein